jgi:hypothetical protein
LVWWWTPSNRYWQLGFLHLSIQSQGVKSTEHFRLHNNRYSIIDYSDNYLLYSWKIKSKKVHAESSLWNFKLYCNHSKSTVTSVMSRMTLFHHSVTVTQSDRLCRQRKMFRKSMSKYLQSNLHYPRKLGARWLACNGN